MMRPTALFALDASAHRSVYGEEITREISRRVELLSSRPAIAAGHFENLPIETVELMFTGWGAPRLDDALLARMPRLRAVFHAAGSIRGFATPAMWERGIRVTTATTVNGEAVANFTVGATILALKQFFALARSARSASSRPAIPGVETGTVALISCGAVARAVIRKLRAFHPRILVYDPFLSSEEAATFEVERVGLAEAFAAGDVVSLHTPLLTETRGLINRPLLAAMRPHATFINTARGAVVNGADLADVLADRPDLTAVLDVTDPEPLPADSLLLALSNAIITPHIAGSTDAECRLMGRFILDELDRWLNQAPLRGEISPERANILA
jgi:phosphoglycerate dehydrogenase-like enzyme